MAKASDNQFPKLLLTPIDPATLTVPSGVFAVVLDSTNSDKLSRVDSSGTVTVIEGGTSGGGGTITTTRATTSASTTLTHGTVIQVSWEAEDFDDDGTHSTSTNPSRFTVATTGRYRFMFVYAVSAARSLYLSARKNGATVLAYGTGISDSGGSDGQCIGKCETGDIELAAGDYIEAQAQMFKAGGSGTTTRATGVPAFAVLERLA